MARTASASTLRSVGPMLRCSGLLAKLNVADKVNGKAVEVYPAAALRGWDLPHRGYKRNAEGGLRKLIVAFEAKTLR